MSDTVVKIRYKGKLPYEALEKLRGSGPNTTKKGKKGYHRTDNKKIIKEEMDKVDGER